MLLEIKNLNIFFRNYLYIEDLNFFVNKGEIFSIVGESGSGKTLTGLAIINLLPDHFSATGKVLFKSKNLLELDLTEIRKIRGKEISYIFQDPSASLNPVLKVGDQVSEIFIYHLGLSKKEAEKKVNEIFQKLKIPHVIKSYPHQLSGGMKQRVMIAIAVALQPEIIIADEPTTAVDVTVQEEILDLLFLITKNENKSLILITHDINILGEYADRVMVMYAGRVMEIAKVESIFKDALHPYTKALVECVPNRGKIKGIPGQIPNLKDLPSGCVFNPRCKYKLTICDKEKPPLKSLSSQHSVRCFLH